MAGGGLGHGVENIVVSQTMIGRENLLAGAARSYGPKNAIQPFP
jgi:hypothetical protein